MFEYFLYRVGQWLALNLPLRCAYAIAVISSYVKYYSNNDRKTVIANLKVVFPNKNLKELVRISKAVFRSFGCYLADFFRFEKLNQRFIESNVKIEGLEYLEESLKNGKGGILLTAHLGNWEMGGVCLAQLGFEVCAVALSHKNKRVDKFFVNQRTMKGLEVVALEDCLQKAVSWIKSNKFFAILGDRNFSADTLKINFFSKAADFPKGPAVLSLRTKAPIIPGFFVREKYNKYRFVFEKPIIPRKKDTIQESIRVITQSYSDVIQKYVSRYPEQWFLFEKFWGK